MRVRVTSACAGADDFDSPHHSPRSLLNNQDSLRLQVPALPTAAAHRPATCRAEGGLSMYGMHLLNFSAPREQREKDFLKISRESLQPALLNSSRCKSGARSLPRIPRAPNAPRPVTALCKRTSCQRKEGTEREIKSSSAALPCPPPRGMAASCAHPATGGPQACGRLAELCRRALPCCLNRLCRQSTTRRRRSTTTTL